MKPAIAVYGATGHTGQFVLRELERRGHPIVAIGRHPVPKAEDALGAVPVRWLQSRCDDADALDAALREVDAVINCAGPFLDTAPAVIESALRAGIHYFDVTAEQRSARQSLATYDDDARNRGTVVVPAVAFFGGLADLLATELTCGAETIEQIAIGVALDFWHPTPGTRTTGERNTARRLIVTDGRFAPLAHPPEIRQWTFPAPFGVQQMRAVPLAEIVTIRRHIAARNVCSYMSTAPLRDLADPHTPPPMATDPSGRSSQRFVMEVRADLDEHRAAIAVAGQDIYAVTAPIVVEACLQVLQNPPAMGGTFAPGELLDTRAIFSALQPHLTVMRREGEPSAMYP
ncbi:MAG: saccharopine dehydrogenase NADP-binding domain-containing protein [Steroidobacteraceae bacterium]